MRLKGKVTLITGGASGIGYETARLFAHEGAKVVIADINKKQGFEAANDIKSCGGDVYFVEVDVTDPSSVEMMVDKTIEKYERIDVLFNNAGISGVGVLHEVDYEKWKKVMDVNVNGIFLVTKYVVPHMIKEKSGSIINMSSSIAGMGLANRAVYAASKGAVYSLTKSMQVDYAPYNIRVNALMPGTIYTPFVENYIRESSDPDSTLKSVKNRQLGGELGKPIDVAYAALYLASDESKFMMGAPFIIDGGLMNGKRA